MRLAPVAIMNEPGAAPGDAASPSAHLRTPSRRTSPPSCKSGGRYERRSTSDRAADAITAFCGSVSFIWTHVAWFAA
jgi:uncharacterized membrane protein